MSTIYWKFKNTKDEFSSVTFDGTHVTILDLKRAIIKQKCLQQTPNQPFDLCITNAHTGVEYSDETGPIPRNLAVIVRRLPAARNQHKKLWAPLQNNQIIATADNISKQKIPQPSISERLTHEFGAPIFNQNASGAQAVNESAKQVQNETMNIIDMMNRRMNHSTTTVTSGGMSRGGGGGARMNAGNNNRGGGMGGMPAKDGGMGMGMGGMKTSYRQQRGDPPPGYICHRCRVSGHWIQDCPTNGDPKFDKSNRMGGRMRTQGGLEHSIPKPVAPMNVSGDTASASTQNIPTTQVVIGRKSYQIPTNVYESFNGDHNKIRAYIEISSGATNAFAQPTSGNVNASDAKYRCEICTQYMSDPRFTPCCHEHFCNECIRRKAVPSDPSIIRCPSCDEVFAAEALDIARNAKLEEKINRLRAEQQLQQQQQQQLLQQQATAAETPSSCTTTTTHVNTNSSNIRVPTTAAAHTLHLPQPVITRTAVRPTVILQQSPPRILTANVTAIVTSLTAAPSTQVTQQQQHIDTKQFEAPKANFVTGDSLNYTCIECGQRGHKYKDCPKVAETKDRIKLEHGQAPTQTHIIKTEHDGAVVKTEASLDGNHGIIRIHHSHSPSKHTHQHNRNYSTNNRQPQPPPPQHQQQRVTPTPQVQLINNSAAALNSISALQNYNLLNMRNRMAVNNLLLNAAALQRARGPGGIAPRLINSSAAAANPLLNSLALSRLSAAAAPNTGNPFALLQQQSFLTQQAAALNQLRGNPLLASTMNNNLNLHRLNATQQQQRQARVLPPPMQQHQQPRPQQQQQQQQAFSLSHIPDKLLQSTIAEIHDAMQSSDQSAITNAINAAFVKLGANDDEAKNSVLQQLVHACSTGKNAAPATTTTTTTQSQLGGAAAGNGKQEMDSDGEERDRKSKKKKKSSSKSKRSSKKKKKDKDRDSEKDKDRKHRRRKKKEKKERRHRSRSDRDGDAGGEGEEEEDENGNTNQQQKEVAKHTSVDFPDSADDREAAEEEEDDEDEDDMNIIHVNVVNDKKRKFETAPMSADFDVPSPPSKRMKMDQNQNMPSPSVSPSPSQSQSK